MVPPRPVGALILGAILAGGARCAPLEARTVQPDSLLGSSPAHASVTIHGDYVVDLLRAVGLGAGANLHHALLGASVGGDHASVRGYVSLFANRGEGLGERLGDIQGTSSIDAPSSTRLYEAWAEVDLAGGDHTLRLGLYDLNGEFYVTEAAGLFLQAANGMGPEFGLTGKAGPSVFPFTTLGVRVAVDLPGDFAWRVAALDGAPGVPGDPEAWGIHLTASEGALLVSEVEWARSDGRLRMLLGGWGYTSSFPSLSPGGGQATSGGNLGLYTVVEGALAGCRDGGACLLGFLRAGRAAPRYNPVAWATGSGLVFETSPDGWALGAALAHAESGEPYRQSEPTQVGPREVGLEVTGRIPVTRHLAILPDAQLLSDPGMCAKHRRVWLGGVRVALTF